MLPVSSIVAQDAEPTPDSLEGLPVDPRFGLVESFWGPEDAAELNVGWDRILFYWNEIQPTGPDDWNTLHVLEEWLVDAEAHDRRVFGLLKNTPAWATDGEPFSGVPRGLYLPIDDPDNLWAGYVAKVVDYYAPRGVHDWIIWNEPEIDAGVYGHEFSGTTADYYQLLKVAYQVIKRPIPRRPSIWRATPTGTTRRFWAGSSTSSWPILKRPTTTTSSTRSRSTSISGWRPWRRLIQEVWDIQRRFGMNKPIWINETNASPNLDPLWPVERPAFPTDLDQQAWYIVQAYALAFGNGRGICWCLQVHRCSTAARWRIVWHRPPRLQPPARVRCLQDESCAI